MGTCICHRYLPDIVNKIFICSIELAFIIKAESKLKNLHARKLVVVSESLHFLCNDTQILSDNGEIITKLFLYSIEELLPRALDPFAIHGCIFTFWNSPICLEASEVVDSYYIGKFKVRLYSLNPPIISVFLHLIPVIKRVSP